MPHLWSAKNELVSMLRGEKIDLLSTQGYKSNIIGHFAAKKVGIPQLSVSRGWTASSWKICLYEMLDRHFLKKADHVVCVSKKQAEKVLQANVEHKRVSVIHNAIDPERFDIADQSSCRKELMSMFSEPVDYILGAAGRLSVEKSFDLLVASIAQLRKKGKNVGLIVFGEGPQRNELNRQIARLDLEKRVLLPGNTSRLDELISSFDIFVQSSKTEGLPNVLLEAALAGVPVVATKVGGTSEVVQSNETGILVSWGKAANISKAIEYLLNQPHLMGEMGLKARNYVQSHFTFSRQVDDYLNLYEELVPDFHFKEDRSVSAVSSL
jgi:glycosyltransferase involved in cell wall biosynthesis